MGVLQIPADETDLMSEIESFIDEKGKIDIEEMKNKGYDDNRIYGMLHEYYLTTANILAEYRKNRKTRSPYKFFLHDKVQYVDKTEDDSRESMVFMNKVKSSYTNNDEFYNKVEEAFKKSELLHIKDKNVRARRNDKIRYSSSAIELSSSKYFCSFSRDLFVRKTKSCHDVRLKIEKIEPNSETEIVFRAPTPFPSFVFQCNGQPTKSSSYTEEIVKVEDTMSEVKHVPLNRGDIPSVTDCTGHVHLKAETKPELPDVDGTGKGHVTKLADESSDESLSIISDSLSSIDGGLQDYVKVYVEKSIEMHDSYDSLESNCVSQTDRSSIQPPPPSVNSETSECISDTSECISDTSECISETTSNQSETTISDSETIVSQSDTSISDSETSVTQSDASKSPSDVIVIQSEYTTEQSHIYHTQSETTISLTETTIKQTELTILSETASKSYSRVKERTSSSVCALVTNNQTISSQTFSNGSYPKSFFSESHNHSHLNMECTVETRSTVSMTNTFENISEHLPLIDENFGPETRSPRN